MTKKSNRGACAGKKPQSSIKNHLLTMKDSSAVKNAVCPDDKQSSDQGDSGQASL